MIWLFMCLDMCCCLCWFGWVKCCRFLLIMWGWCFRCMLCIVMVVLVNGGKGWMVSLCCCRCVV